MEPDKRLQNKKVYVKDKSKEIQEKAFQLGYGWNESHSRIPSYMDAPFLYFNDNGRLSFGKDMENFLNHQCKEVTIDYILSLQPEPEEKEYHFKPFDRVLVRDFDNGTWIPRFFWKKEDMEKAPFVVIGGTRWRQCVPFKGEKSQCAFNMFEKVLVRRADEAWKPEFFAKYDSANKKFVTVTGLIYDKCVPYEGNESIGDTCKEPNVERKII